MQATAEMQPHLYLSRVSLSVYFLRCLHGSGTAHMPCAVCLEFLELRPPAAVTAGLTVASPHSGTKAPAACPLPQLRRRRLRRTTTLATDIGKFSFLSAQPGRCTAGQGVRGVTQLGDVLCFLPPLGIYPHIAQHDDISRRMELRSPLMMIRKHDLL